MILRRTMGISYSKKIKIWILIWIFAYMKHSIRLVESDKTCLKCGNRSMLTKYFKVKTRKKLKLFRHIVFSLIGISIILKHWKKTGFYRQLGVLYNLKRVENRFNEKFVLNINLVLQNSGLWDPMIYKLVTFPR